MKLNIDTNIQLPLYKASQFSERPQKIEKIFLMNVIKTYFALLNGWNVTKLVLATHVREWRNPVSGFRNTLGLAYNKCISQFVQKISEQV
jgi:hypothetical protein